MSLRGNRYWTAQVNDDGAKQRGQIADSSVLQIHAATQAFNLYATMADAVDETYFQVGASLPTWKGGLIKLGCEREVMGMTLGKKCVLRGGRGVHAHANIITCVGDTCE